MTFLWLAILLVVVALVTAWFVVALSRAERRARRAFFLTQGLNAETTELLTSRSRDLSSDLALVRSEQLPLAPDHAASGHSNWPPRRKRPFIRLVHPRETESRPGDSNSSDRPQD